MIEYSFISKTSHPTDSFKEYLIKKLSKIDWLLDDAAADAKVTLEKNNNSNYDLTITLIVKNIRQNVSEKTYKASSTHSDAYAAVDLVEDKLKRQIRKTLTTINRDDRRLKSFKNTL